MSQEKYKKIINENIKVDLKKISSLHNKKYNVAKIKNKNICLVNKNLKKIASCVNFKFKFLK